MSDARAYRRLVGSEVFEKWMVECRDVFTRRAENEPFLPRLVWTSVSRDVECVWKVALIGKVTGVRRRCLIEAQLPLG